jgi:hypothetical protein
VCYINSTKEHKSCKDQSYYLHLAMQVKNEISGCTSLFL